ncbi:hypothetical protein BH20ACT8_BH20ACT8_07650 [soil metagenome]
MSRVVSSVMAAVRGDCAGTVVAFGVVVVVQIC